MFYLIGFTSLFLLFVFFSYYLIGSIKSRQNWYSNIDETFENGITVLNVLLKPFIFQRLPFRALF